MKDEPTRGKRGLWAKRLGLSLGTTAAALLMVEVALRLLGLAPDRWVQPLHLESEDKRFGLDAYPEAAPGAFDVDLADPAERARWAARGVPGVEQAGRSRPFAVALEYDEHLCRGAHLGPRDPGVPRIIMIGDSFTEGQGVRQQDTFAARLGRALEGRAEVINCGRRGHDFPQIREFFERQLALEPDLVVYAMTLNDAQRTEAFNARQAYLDDWILDRRRMIREDQGATPPFWTPRLLTLIRDRLEGLRVGRETTRWYREMYGEPNREGWTATQRQIGQMQSAMEARGGRLLVALLPLLIELDGDYPFREVDGTIAAALTEGERPVDYLDTTPAFLGRRAEALWVHPADRHPNAEGHRLIAEALRPEVERLLERAGSRQR